MSRPFIDLPSSAPADPLKLDRLIVELRAALKTLEALRGVEASPLEQPVAASEIADCVRTYLAGRRARQSLIPGDWFADPAWDLLLDLLVCSFDHRKISITSACIAAAVPPTTALRCIERLVAVGAVRRSDDPLDRRRALIALDSHLAARLEDWVRTSLMRHSVDRPPAPPPTSPVSLVGNCRQR